MSLCLFWLLVVCFARLVLYVVGGIPIRDSFPDLGCILRYFSCDSPARGLVTFRVFGCGGSPLQKVGSRRLVGFRVAFYIGQARFSVPVSL